MKNDEYILAQDREIEQATGLKDPPLELDGRGNIDLQPRIPSPIHIILQTDIPPDPASPWQSMPLELSRTTTGVSAVTGGTLTPLQGSE